MVIEYSCGAIATTAIFSQSPVRCFTIHFGQRHEDRLQSEPYCVSHLRNNVRNSCLSHPIVQCNSFKHVPSSLNKTPL